MADIAVSLDYECVYKVLACWRYYITKEITKWFDPVDVVTLSNGIEVGRISTQTAIPYTYPMLLIGNCCISPSTRGKEAIQAFIGCLNEVDAGIVNTLMFKITYERELSSGNKKNR